jgi:peptide/nickel transport system substrate-binding protein
VASFVPNPHYRPRAEPPDGLAGGKVVKVDRVDIMSIADQTTRSTALEAGELDWLEIAPLDYVANLRANPDVVVGKPRGMDQFLAILNINHADPPFNNIKVRKALQAAIVQPEIAAAVGLPDDLVTPFCGSIYMCNTPGSTDAGTEALKQASAEHARQLLKESGYAGEPVVIFHSRTSALLNPIGLVVAAQLRRAGFNVQVESRDSATMQQRRLQRTGWSIVPIVTNGIDLMNPLASQLVAGNCLENTPGWYCDPKMTELLRQYSVAREPGERRRLADQIQIAFHENVNYVIAGQFAAPAAWRSSLTGVVPFTFPVFWNVSRRTEK